MTSTAELQAVIDAAKVFAFSPVGIALQVALGWIVLDAMMTAALELKLGRFAPEAFSYFLEKLGGEFVGLLTLGVAGYISPILLPAFVAASGAFIVTESNGAWQKIQAFIASNKAS